MQFLYHELDIKERNDEYPFVKLDKNIKNLSLFIVKELSENSCIWQLFGHFCLCIVLEEDHIKLYKNIPVHYAKYNLNLDSKDIIIITLSIIFLYQSV